MKVRKLTMADVTFSVELEPEDLPVDFESGDPEYREEEKKQEREIIRRLDQGDTEAWCCVVVTAEWEGIKGTATLGVCSYGPGDGYTIEREANETVEEHGMRKEALDDLNKELQRKADRCAAFLKKVSIG